MTEHITERVEIMLQDRMQFEATNADQVRVTLDAPARHGGGGAGFGPMELLLVGLGTCTGMDVISILRKKRQAVTEYTVVVDGVRAGEHPKVFTDITIRHILRGSDLSEEAVRRSIELSETTYCPAFAMLRQAAHISSSYEILAASPRD